MLRKSLLLLESHSKIGIFKEEKSTFVINVVLFLFPLFKRKIFFRCLHCLPFPPLSTNLQTIF